eukprot:363525-Chlamydomonas_euryale.AAC.12
MWPCADSGTANAGCEPWSLESSEPPSPAPRKLSSWPRGRVPSGERGKIGCAIALATRRDRLERPTM